MLLSFYKGQIHSVSPLSWNFTELDHLLHEQEALLAVLRGLGVREGVEQLDPAVRKLDDRDSHVADQLLMILARGLELAGGQLPLDDLLGGAGVLHEALQRLPEAGGAVMRAGVRGEEVAGAGAGVAVLHLLVLLLLPARVHHRHRRAVAQPRQAQRQQVRLGGEHELRDVQELVLLLGEQQVQVLEGLGDDEAVHPVLVLQCPHILHRGVPAGHARVLLQGAQHLLPHAQVVRVPGGLVQEVGGLHELWPQEVLASVDLEVRGDGLGQEVVPLHDLVEDLVLLDGRLQVPHEHLQTRPEGAEAVHEVF